MFIKIFIFFFPFPLFNLFVLFFFKVIEMSDFSFSNNLRYVKDLLQQCVISIIGNEKIVGYKLNLPQTIASKLNSKEQIYIINFDADTLYQYLLLKHVSTRNGDEAKKILIRSFYNEVLNQYISTSTFHQMLFFHNNNLILMGKMSTPNSNNQPFYGANIKHFVTLGGAFYQVIPSQGVFISILHVIRKYRNRYFGKLILSVLQQISKKVLNSQRLLVWVTRLPIQKRKKGKTYVDPNSHIIFYRKLGFFPSNPLNLPLDQMVTSELALMMKEPMSTFDTQTVENDSVEYVLELYQRIAWEPKTKTTNECCSCFVSDKDLLISCKTDNCGLNMCIRCYSQFSMKIATDRCLFHMTNKFLGPSSIAKKVTLFHKMILTCCQGNNSMIVQKKQRKLWSMVVKYVV